MKSNKKTEVNNYMLLLDNGSKISLDIPQENFEEIWAEFESAMIRHGFFYAEALECEANLNGNELSIINAGRIIGITN